jgi:hypothetical protein
LNASTLLSIPRPASPVAAFGVIKPIDDLDGHEAGVKARARYSRTSIHALSQGASKTFTNTGTRKSRPAASPACVIVIRS